MQETITTAARTLLALLLLMAGAAMALDFPHTPSNSTLPGLGCLNCHDLDSPEAKLLKPSTPHPGMNRDDTNSNNLCWSCHTGPQLAPYRVPHSSEQTGDQFGDWSIECRTCHWPHSQLQFKVYGEQSYLASGTLTQVASGPQVSTLTDAGANWQENEHAGRVVYPNLDAENPVNPATPLDDLSYRVLSNTATTLTLDGPIDLGRIAPGNRYAIIYGKLIKDAIKVPGSGEPGVWKKVKFFRNRGANSYADSDATLDGVCQVCHTKTSHFRNDGGGEDQMHRNANRGNPNGTAGETCTAKCHKHIGGFGHGKGYTRVDLCVECHGHEEGTYYMVDGKYPYNPSDPARLSPVPSRGFGSTTAHSTHTESWITSGPGWGETTPASAGADDRRGPGIYCNNCHDIERMPTFKSGVDRNGDGLFTLDETDVCDGCHSPEGSYNGVDSVGDSVGAKDNWRSNGVYRADNTTLKPGKEKWCAGCHDEWQADAPDSSHVDTRAWDAETGITRNVDVFAPPVIGDEDAPYTYGVGWGFYKTGHGLPSDQFIPSSGGSKPGPGRECNDCHDPRLPHIDGNQRTYGCADGCDPAEYQRGYRLKYPMQMPLTDGYIPPKESNYQLCFSCHDFEAITDAADGGNGPQTSNYYDDTQSPNKNLHYRHLARGAINVSSDWSGEWNSKLTCIVCHNPHGTSNFAMIRTGKILEVDPDAGAAQKQGLRVWYGNSGITSRPNGKFPPDPPDLTLSASDRAYFWGPVATYGYCAEQCHGSTIYEVTRTPVQNTEQPPMLEWAGATGFEQDGVSPDAAVSGVRFRFRVKYRDWDNDAPDQAAPRSIYLWVDRNNNDQFEAESERFVMDEIAGQGAPYSVGRLYGKELTLSRVGDGRIKYYFEASDEDGPATGPATLVNTLTVLNSVPQLAWTGEHGYESDGVHPDTGGDGARFTFRVRYSDGDGDPPAAVQLLEDRDNDGVADASYAMTPAADGDYRTGRIYSHTRSLRHADAGTVRYAFRAGDGADAATGDPTGWSRLSVLSGGNSPAVLQWVTDAADCWSDSAKPRVTLRSEPVTFRLRYTDVDDWGAGPGAVTLRVDLDGNGVYDGGAEAVAMTLEGSGGNWATTGEYYTVTVTPTASGQLKYRFSAVDVGPAGSDADAAIGDPATTDKYLRVYERGVTTVGVRKSPVSNGPVWYNSVQQAIDAVDGAHRVLVDQGTYVENLYLQSNNGNDNDTTLQSVCGADLTILQATAPENNVIYLQGVSGTIVIDGFQITGGLSGVSTNYSGAMEIKNSRIHGNNRSGSDGGGIYLGGSVSLRISDSEIYANSAGRGGGIAINSGANPLFQNTVFRDNAATGAGGAIFLQNITGALTLTDVTLTDNSAGAAGGAIYSNGEAVNASRCTLSGNQAAGEGGGAYLSAAGRFDNCVVSDNTAAARGGGFMVNGGVPLVLNNSTLANNFSATLGGGLFSNGGAITLENSILWGNRSGAGSGHAVYSNGGAAVTISDAIVQNDGDPDPFDAPVFAPTSNPPAVAGYLSGNDPNFVDAAGRDYRIQPLSDAIDHAGAGALADDRDGRPRGDAADIGAHEYQGLDWIPALAWTGEPGLDAGGVTPERAPGGSDFEFRVDYRNAGGLPPARMEVWIDANDNGVFEASEKHAMTRMSGATGPFDDGDFRNGERYRYVAPLYHPRDGALNYRFFSAAGGQVALGAPTRPRQVVVDNGVPLLRWPGDVNFENDGVHPNAGAAGDTFLFRVKYQDADGDAPKVAQVWIDANDDHRYSESEKHALTREGAGTDYRNGEIYVSQPVTIYSAGDERLRYRFYFTDGKSTATGAPTNVERAKARYSRYLIASTAPTLNWTGEAYYVAGGVYPDTAMGRATFEFRVNYTDPLNRPPSPIQLWVDANDNGVYEADEKHAMLASDQADDNYTDGKIYSKTLSLSAAGDEQISYRFFALTGTVAAGGAAASGGLLNINFTQTVSGRVYQDSGVTPIADGSVIRLVHNGMMAGTAVTSGGAYSIPAVYAPGDRLIVCIEGNPFNGNSMAVSTGEDITDLDIYGGPGVISWECLRYVTYAPLDNATHITIARAVATPGADDSIDVTMGYSGDADANNRYTVRYCRQDACDSWTDHLVDAPHAASPYLTTISGLTPGATYRVQLRYIDDEVQGTNPVEISGITLPFNGVTPGVAMASARSVDSLFVRMPYTNDANANSRYRLEYKRSSETLWKQWEPDPQPHAASPFSTAITGLVTGETYDVRMTYIDADGIAGGEPSTQTIRHIGLANNGTIALTASVSPAGAGAIRVSMPYLQDSNADNTYRVEYKPSDAETWQLWGAEREPHVASPFETTITGLQGGRMYDVRVTFYDDNGFIAGFPQQTLTRYLPYGDQVVCQQDCSGIGPYHTSIQAAIDAAGNGDLVVVLPGVYAENLTLGTDGPGGADYVDISLRSRDGADSVRVTGTGADRPVLEIRSGNRSTIRGFTFDNARSGGGNNSRGIYIFGASPAFEQIVVEDNATYAYAHGAGVYIFSGEPRFTRSWIRGNYGDEGAGIYCRLGSVTLVNALVTGNGESGQSNEGAGLYLLSGCAATIVNSTFAGNRAQKGGAIKGPGQVTARYSIFWGNQDEAFSQEDQLAAGYDVAYSVVQGGYAGVGNRMNDPKFVSPAAAADAPTTAGDYHLQGYAHTPDAVLDLQLEGGDTLVPLTPADDYEGNPRPRGAGYTMGAYEVAAP